MILSPVRSSFVLVSILAFSLIGCNSTERVIERQAPKDVKESFAQTSCEQTVCLKINKESLSKVFMMISSGKGGGATPQWYDFKPQLVSFDRVGDRIALFEENYRSVYEEIKNRELIQTFSIVSEDAKQVTFKWGQGVQTLVYESPIDVEGPAGMPKSEEEDGMKREYLNVVDSVTTSAKVSENLMELHQVSKVRSFDPKKGFSDETLGMNIQFYPYEPSQEFQKRTPETNRLVGFFVTKTGVKNYSNRETSLINHWDISKPIKVLISSAVPEDFVGAVKEGSLYWNKVLGKEVIQVVTGVDPSVEPQQRSIVLRWIPWLDSGAAYATHQTDPITGEILRAQVFMPSIFTRVGSLDLLTLNGDYPVARGQGFSACNLTEKFADLKVMMKEASDSKRLQLAQDSVRATVAHELGHALGMRHNFAGSYSAKVSTKTVLKTAAEYLKDPKHEGLETSTSIMDYASGIDDVLLSARLKYAPLSYDKMAMDYAYAGTTPSTDISLFCTDEDISIAKAQGKEIYGCQRFDAGNNPLYRKLLDAEDEKNKFIKLLFTSIVGRKFPSNQSEPVKETQVILAETMQWMQINVDSLEYVNNVVFDLKKDSNISSRFVSLEKYLKNPFALTKDDEDVILGTKLKRDIQELGGLSRLFTSLALNAKKELDTNWYQLQLLDLIEQDYFVKGRTLGGRDYQLTTDDMKKVVGFFDNFTDLNHFALLIGVNKYLLPKTIEIPEQGRADQVLKSTLHGLYTDDIANLSKAWLFTVTKTEKGSAGVVDNKEVEVPVYLFSGNERLLANSLVDSAAMGEGATKAREALAAELKSKIVSVLTMALDGKSFDQSLEGLSTAFNVVKTSGTASNNVIKWLEQELELLKKLSPKSQGKTLADKI